MLVGVVEQIPLNGLVEGRDVDVPWKRGMPTSSGAILPVNGMRVQITLP